MQTGGSSVRLDARGRNRQTPPTEDASSRARRHQEEPPSDDHVSEAHRRARPRRGLRRRAPAAAARRPTPAATDGRIAAPHAAGAASGPAGGVTGSIIVSGSSTVEPISTGVAELFKQANPDFNYTDRGPGHRRRLQALLHRRDRHLRRLAQDQGRGGRRPAQTAGIEYVELKIAYDGITVMTNPANTAITCLSLRRPLRPRSAPSRPASTPGPTAAPLAKELGSNTALPDAAARRSPAPARSPARSTPSSSSRSPRSPSRAARSTRSTTRPDYTASANDNAIIEGIAGSPTRRSAGSASPSPRRTRTRSRRSRSARTPTGPASPRPPRPSPTARYPLSRSLYIYVNKAKAAANPAVVAYVDYYLAEGTITKVLETVPYVNLPGRRSSPPRGPPGTPPSSLTLLRGTGRASSEARPVSFVPARLA